MHSIILAIAVLIAVCTGGAIAVLRYAPERWDSLNIKVGAFQLRASQSDDE
jgi:hypothetical protein